MSFLHHSLLLAASALLCNGAPTPNVIYILMDDLGYGDLGCYGQQRIKTPHIDALAAEGIRFTQNYAGSPVSAPSRCVTLTGLHSGHAFIRGNDELANRGNVWSHAAMLKDASLEGQLPLPAATRTIAHLMQDAGYKTAMIGKWGLGYPGSEGSPNKMGFDFFYGYNCQRQAHSYYPMFLYRNDKREMLDNAPLLIPNARLARGNDAQDARSYEKYVRAEYSCDLMFEELLRFVKKQDKEPFFLMWTTPIPHVALQAPQHWVDFYRREFGEEKAYLGGRGYLPCRYPKATYAAMISYFDEQVGKLVAELKAEGIDDDTIIFFVSDNGPTFNGGSNSAWFDSAKPFRSDMGWGKASLREGGIRVPMIIRWPALIKQARVSDHITASYDIFPTLADIVGEPAPKHLDGISLLPELQGKPQPEHEALYWEYPEGNGSCALRMGRWKALIRNLKKGNTTMELYDLDSDPREEHNLASQRPEIVAKLRVIIRREHARAQHARFDLPALRELP